MVSLLFANLYIYRPSRSLNNFSSFSTLPFYIVLISSTYLVLFLFNFAFTLTIILVGYVCNILPGLLGVASRLTQTCLIKSYNYNPNLPQLTCKCITQRLYNISSSGNKFNGVTYGILNLPAVFFVLFSTRTDLIKFLNRFDPLSSSRTVHI